MERLKFLHGLLGDLDFYVEIVSQHYQIAY